MAVRTDRQREQVLANRRFARNRAVHRAGVVARWSAVAVLAGHGLIHAMGVTLLWRLGEPAALQYADGTPDPGSVAGLAAGVVWAVAGLLFVAAAVLLAARRRRWLPVAVAAAAVSLPAVLLMAGAAPVGVAADALVLLAGGGMLAGRRVQWPR
jgi:hypothetical protein